MNDNTNTPDPNNQPIFNVPSIILVGLVLFLGIHFYVDQLSPEEQYKFIIDFAFIPSLLQESLDWNALRRLITFQFVHGHWPHVIMNAFGLLAFGSASVQRLGARKSFDIFVISGLGGAFAHAFLFNFPETPMVGASAGISGLLAIVFLRLQEQGFYPKGLKGLLPVSLVWIAINAAIGFINIPGMAFMNVAWIAHIGGYVVGLFMGQYYFSNISKI